MHPADRVHRALELAHTGLSQTEIARRTGIPRRTICDWVRHGPPRGRSRVDRSMSCLDCGWHAHAFDDLSPVCDACDLLGLRWTVAPRTVYVSRKDDVALLDKFVGPKS